MDFANIFQNYDFIKLGELDFFSNTKIVILYARFMHNSSKAWTLDTHAHSFYELHFPLNGTCSLVLQNADRQALGVNDHVLIYPNTNHKFTDFSENFLRLSIAFDIQHGDNMMIESDKYVIDTSGEPIRRLLDQMLMEYHTQQPGYKSMVNFYIQAALIEILRTYSDILCSDENKLDSTQKTFQQALHFIKNHISLNITTEDVSKHVNLSSRQLNRIFDTNLAMTITEFIRNERILRVQEHLKKTALSLREIAVLTGFNDEYILCKTFKKITGITPGKYRSDHLKKKKVPL